MQYSIGTKVNNGRFGNVYRVQKDGQVYAAKLLPKHRIDVPDNVNKAMIQREINNHKKVNGHKNIVNLVEIVEDWGNFYIIEEYCEKGDLCNYIAKNVVSEAMSKKILKDCLNGLVMCHDAGFIFGDLKPANVLVGKKDFKLCDFGGSQCAEGMYSGSTHIRGTPAFLAPEVYLHRADHGYISDMWSLGVIAYMLLYQKYPYEVRSTCTAKEFKTILRETEIDYSGKIPPEGEDFIKRCLRKDALERITPKDALMHDFLKDELENVSLEPDEARSIRVL